MAAAKIIGLLLLVILLPVGVVSVDLYQTNQVIQQTDFSTVIDDPTYSVSDDNSTVTISVTVDLPKAGFLPKGVIFDVTVNFDGEVQTSMQSVAFGESKVIAMDFTLTEEDKQTLVTGGSLTVSGTAEITPTYFGFAITQLTQQIDLGSQTISA